MRWKLLACVGFIGAITLFTASPAEALGLRVAPTTYQTTLKQGEKKKGVIDVTNPDDKETLVVTTSTQAFRQINSGGDLEYYDDPQVAAGLVPDFATFTLKPHETMRMYFLLDGTKLPSGNVFGALMFTTKSNVAISTTEVVSEVRVGVLFSIVNGTPSTSQATITNVDIPFWQLSGVVKGNYSVKNTGDVTKSTGFFPDVTVAMSPFSKQTIVTSPLVFPGIERTHGFEMSTGRFGFYMVTVSYGETKKEAWVFVAQPWQIAGILLVIAVVAGVFGWRSLRSRRRTHWKR